MWLRAPLLQNPFDAVVATIIKNENIASVNDIEAMNSMPSTK